MRRLPRYLKTSIRLTLMAGATLVPQPAAAASPSLAGTVSVDGHPLAGARVTASRCASQPDPVGPEGRIEVTTKTETSGGWRFDLPSAGCWEVRLSHPGKATAALWLPSVTSSQVTPPASLEPVRPLDVLVTSAGVPVPDAAVLVGPVASGGAAASWQIAGATATSGGAGIARVAVPHRAVVVFAGQAGLGAGRVRANPEESRVEVVLDRSGSRDVRILSGGQPLAGATLWFGGGVLLAGTTNSSGSATLWGPPSLLHRVSVAAKGHVTFYPPPSQATPDVLELEQVVPLTGTVVEKTTGRALAGAFVFTSGDWAVTDTDGLFALDGEASRTVRVDRHGFVTTTARVAADQPGVVELSPAAGISGRVVSAGGEPIAAVRVVAINEMLSFNRPESRSDENGRFVVGGLGPGRWRCLFEADGFAPQLSEILVTTVEGPAAELVATLEPGVQARVLVVDHQDDRPLKGVQVELSLPHDGGEPLFLPFLEERGLDRTIAIVRTTDDKGLAMFEHVGPGAYTLRATHPDRELLVLNAVSVDQTGDNHFDIGTLALRPKEGIRVAVVDHRGEPVGGAIGFATVVRGGTHEQELPPVAADADGLLTIRGLDPGTTVHLTVLAKGAVVAVPGLRATAEIGIVELPEPGSIDLVASAPDEAAITLEAQLQRPWGAPQAIQRLLPGLEVDLGQRAVQLTPLSPGDWELNLTANGTTYTTIATVRPGQTTDVVLDLPVPLAVRGTVRDKQGRPIGGVHVSFLPERSTNSTLRTKVPSQTSDESGGFAFAGIVQSGAIVATKTGHREARLSVQPGGPDLDLVELVLAEPTRISGVVLGPDRSPLPFVRVVARLATGRNTEQANTDANGFFEFPLRDGGGSAVLTVTHADTLSATARIEVPDGEHRDGVIIFAGDGAIVHGHVVGLSAEQLASAQVEARCDGHAPIRTTVPAWTGEFVLDGLASGRCFVRAFDRDRRSSPAVGLEIEAPYNHGPLELVVASRALFGQAFANGQPLAGSRLRVKDQAGAGTNTFGDVGPTGEFRLEGVGGDAAWLSFDDGLTAVVAIPPSGEDLGQLAVEVGAIQVLVADADGRPLASVALSLAHLGPGPSRLVFRTTLATGLLALPRIAAGTWRLRGPQGSVEFEVAAGEVVDGTLTLREP